MFKIRPVRSTELPLLKGFAPAEWNTDFSVTFSSHFGLPYFHPIVAELEGQIVGCAQGLLNWKTGWLGNIVVLPDYRGRGIGQALTQDLVDFFHAKRCTSQVLIATSLGEPVYRRLGFAVTSRYIFLKRTNLLAPDTSRHIRPARKEDFASIISLDREATGEDRLLLLRRFMDDARIYEENNSQGIEGFFLPALGVGPVIARTVNAGLALLRFRLGQGKNSNVVPEGNTPALDYLRGAGFEEFNSAPRMALGKELEWKPSWVFSRGAGYCG